MLSRVKEEIGDHGVDTQDRECTPQEERKALLRGDVIIALQENEAKLFKQLVPEREVVVLGFTPPRIISAPGNSVVPGTVFMVGGDNPLNRRGLLLFCSEVWPKVLKKIPEAQLRIAGPVGTSLPEHTPNALALGRLETLENEYLSACVVVNSVDLGTGLKIKTVEALCYGKAVVSTDKGVEGLQLKNSAPFLVASDWNDFADKVIELLKDEGLRRRLEQHAVSYANVHFTDEMVYAELKHCLEKKKYKETLCR
jgi:glycosyltransferase involved in cell wall biosynthesis